MSDNPVERRNANNPHGQKFPKQQIYSQIDVDEVLSRRHARIAELEVENSVLAAGQCHFVNTGEGLRADDCGNTYCLKDKQLKAAIAQRDAALAQLATARAERAQIESGIAEMLSALADYFAPLTAEHPKVAEAVAAMRAAFESHSIMQPATGDAANRPEGE